jgi:DNA-binding response OmpR family regulator
MNAPSGPRFFERTRKLLAIEDDPNILLGYETFFGCEGFEVVCATTAAEGMTMLRRHADTDVVLLDLNLAETSGETWLKWIDQESHGAAVILTSADPRLLRVHSQRTPTAAIAKPFPMEDLLSLIELVLDGNYPRDHTAH